MESLETTAQQELPKEMKELKEILKIYALNNDRSWMIEDYIYTNCVKITTRSLFNSDLAFITDLSNHDYYSCMIGRDDNITIFIHTI